MVSLKRKYFERIDVMKKRRICHLVLFVCLLLAGIASAGSWDLYDDMNIGSYSNPTGNPSGQWSYGLGALLPNEDITSIPDTSALVLFDKVSDLSNCSSGDVGLLGSVKKWGLWSLATDSAQLVRHTPGEDSHLYGDNTYNWRGVPQGSCGAKPGDPGFNYPVVARWTSPIAGVVQVHGSFGQCIWNQQSGRWVKHNSTVLLSVPSANYETPFDFLVTVAVGDKIDFIVTQGSGVYNDQIPLVAKIDTKIMPYWDLYKELNFNPPPQSNGSWSYGLGIKLSDQDITSTPDANTLTLFDKIFDLSNSSSEDVGALGSVKKWALASLNVTDALLVKHTIGNDTHANSDDPNTWHGVPQGQTGLMPGKAGRNYPIVVRWTSRVAGIVHIYGSFGQCMGTQHSGRWIKHNSTVKLSVPSTNSEVTFNFTVTVAVGDKIDFIVTQGGDLDNDVTPLVAIIDGRTCEDLTPSQYQYFPMDFNHDCYVNFADFAILAQNWLMCNASEDPVCATYNPVDFTEDYPFSFVYGGIASKDILPQWIMDRQTTVLDQNRIQEITTWADPYYKGGLVVTFKKITYSDFPGTVEWTVYFKNTGSGNTPIIENIRALDVEFDPSQAGNFLLHHANGAFATGDANGYKPLTTILSPYTTKVLAGINGQPSGQDMPYFNLEFPNNQGVVMAIGWPGQWSSNFTREAAGTGVRVVAGQELTHFKLYPGEEVRGPLIALQFWQGGDWISAQNIWRRWMMAHNVPKKANGEPLEPLMFGSSAFQTNCMVEATTANQLQFINRYLEEQLTIDYWWMDAGWYPLGGSDWTWTGTWEVDTTRFPNGLREISDYAHSNGIKTLLWFEPERVATGTWLDVNHPEWVFGRNWGLLDEGNPDAFNWLINHVDSLLTAQGIDLYREDFNFEPLIYWRSNDTSNRQGITEIRHVEGHLAYWDELIKRDPNRLIDSCASGGRRNDLETMRRAVPLWRSDYYIQASAVQGHTYGISFWLPLNGTKNSAFNYTPNKMLTPYEFRSCIVPFTNCLWDVRRTDVDYNELRSLMQNFRDVAKYCLGDYYPLSAHSVAEDQWIAWQFDVPETGEGMVQAFRRPANGTSTGQYNLRGLLPGAQYQYWYIDTPGSKTTRTGQQLMDGLNVSIGTQPGAVIILYKKIS